MSEDAITKIENDHRRARPSTVRKLAKALNVEPRELMASEREASPSVMERGTVTISRDVLWNALEAARGNKQLEPEVSREATEALMHN